LVRPNGTSVPVELIASAMRSSPNELAGYVVIVRNLTEPRRRANTQRLEALGQMASGIAHDLNQSLALITGYVELARQELAVTGAPVDTRMIGEHLEVAWQAAMDGGHVIKRLLAFARAHEKPALDSVNVSMLLEEICRLTAPRWRDAAQAESRPISLCLQADANLHILGDPASLRQALVNLVFNAVDALPCGGKITLTGYEDHQQVVISVSDTGTGMTPEVRQRIFDPFYTTKGEGGTGLGLPQVDAIVQQHGGEIEVESDSGVGTTFRITLPMAKPPMEEPDRPPANETRFSGLRVLIVEDEPKLATMASLLLARDHHHISVVNSAEQALEHLGSQLVDVVLSDLGLGEGMNGWELADHVRRRWPGTRMLLATGWGAAIDPEEARSRGIDVVLAKPYRAAELRTAVTSALAAGRTPESVPSTSD
jgi:signal transduction histidine kinase/ActR/RegA family two-component response regulator